MPRTTVGLLATLALAAAFLAACGGAASPPAAASAPRAYYVSRAGDDRGPGTAERPWRTLERVNRGRYGPGDRILLQGGATFAGSIVLSPETARTEPGRPLVIGSYGKGRATIASPPGGNGITVVNLGGVFVHRLAVVGPSAASGGSGVAVFNDSGRTLGGIRILDVEVEGQTSGILMLVGDRPSRLRDVRIGRVFAHDNAQGIALFGYLEPGRGYGLVDVRIRDARAFRNTGAGLEDGYGAGIFVLGADRLLVEGNRVRDNGGDNPSDPPNGPSGITVYVSRSVVVRGNDISGQRYDVRNQTDNGGLDVWARDGLIEGNVIRGNEGWGLVLGSAAVQDPVAGADLSQDLTVRGNVVERNGCRLPDSEATEPYAGAAVLMFGQLERIALVGNTFSRDCSVPPGADPDAVQGVVYLVDVPGAGRPWRDIVLRKNRIAALGVPTLVEVPRPEAGSGLLLAGNEYEARGEGPRVKWGAKTFDDVRTWAEETGQEGGR